MIAAVGSPSPMLCPPAHVHGNKQWGPDIPLYMLKTSGSSTGLNPYPEKSSKRKCAFDARFPSLAVICSGISLEKLTSCKSFTQH